MTDIEGVGPGLAKKLQRAPVSAGETRIRHIAEEPVDDLAQIQGIGRSRANQIKDAATAATGPEFEELEDLDGVGKTNARRLRDAGIRDPHELRGKSQREIAAINGIGPKRAARIRADVEFEAPAGATETGFDPETETGSKVFRESRETSLAPFDENLKTPDGDGGVKPVAGNVFVRGDDRQQAIKKHAERSPESRRADESFNAPLMLDVDKWARNKSKYDYPGVDTIPRSRKLERARERAARAKSAGFLDNIQADTEATSDWRTRGEYSFGGIEIDTSFRQSEDTLAHELGHAVDDSTGRPSGVTARGNPDGPGIFDDEEVFEQARELSKQRRGRELDTEYLESRNEIFADLFAEATINPRRAKKEAPDAVRAMNESIGMDIGYF